MDAREFFQKVWSRDTRNSFDDGVDRCPGPSFVRSVSPQCKRLIVPAMQPATLAQRMATSVADSVFPEAKAKDYTREQWEAALDKAKQRTEPESWPLIITDDFF
jgi:hypothetical protein